MRHSGTSSRWAARIGILAAATLATTGLAVTSAEAIPATIDLAIAPSPDVFSLGRAATFTLTLKTHAGETDPQTLTDILFTPSCKNQTGSDGICDDLDNGVFVLTAANGIGACPGAFTLAPPTAQGAVLLNRSGGVVLPVAGTCTITVNATILKMPQDAKPTPGVQTLSLLSATATDPGGSVPHTAEQAVSVNKAVPTMVSKAGATSTGGTLRDVVTLAGRYKPESSATATFSLYAPSDPTCQSAPVFTYVKQVPTTSSKVVSGGYRALVDGDYHWKVDYSGDAFNDEVSSACGTTGETSTVTVSRCFGHVATKLGNDGDEVIQGTSGDDVIITLGGKDIVKGGRGNDLICTGSGRDVVRAGAGIDHVQGGSGPDRLIGGGGNDRLDGNQGNDVLEGRNGDDRLHGNRGNDRLDGGRGHDVGTGGNGRDTLISIESDG